MNVRRSMLAVTGVAALLMTGCGGDGSAPTPAAGTASSASSAGSAPADGSSPSGKPAAPSVTDSGSASVAPAEMTPGPDVPAHPHKQTRVLDSLDGSSGQECVAVGDGGDLRSGAIAVGNFAQARAAYADAADTMEQPEVHFYVIPEHLGGDKGATLTLTPTRGGPPRTVEVRAVQSADVWKYYAVNITVPGPGSYRLTAEAGGDRGCFVVDFAKS